MNTIDYIVVLILILGMLYGMKKGFLNGIVSLAGIIISTIIAFVLKGFLSNVYIKGLPFIEFGGKFKGITSLNILMYDALAFITIFLLCMSIVHIVLKVTGILQKIIDYSVVLTLPSKILGAIIGLVNAFIIIFITLFVLININSTREKVYESKIGNYIIGEAFLVSDVTDDYYDSVKVINKVLDECDSNKKICNALVANTLIKYNIITKEDTLKLIDSHKLKNISRKEII